MDPRLETDGLVLEPLSEKYERFYIELANNPAVREHVNNSIPYMKEHFDALLARGPNANRHVWIIEEGGKPLGAITFGALKAHPQIFQGGYWLDPSAWGRGVATRAMTLVSEYLLRSRAAERIQAIVEPGNTASMRVLEKCGFRHEGLLHKYFPSRNKGLLDVHMYALTQPV